MKTFEIIPIREDNFIETSTGRALINISLEVKADDLKIENGIAVFYENYNIIHTAPVYKVCIRMFQK